MTLSTHVLDAARGLPAVGLDAVLHGLDGATTPATTDDDGRISWPGHPDPGTYALELATGPWFTAQGRDTFYPSIRLTFTVAAGHTHVALLLSPYSYTTYKGS